MLVTDPVGKPVQSPTQSKREALSTQPKACPYQVTNFGFDFELGLEFGLVNNKGVSGTNKEIY